MVLLAAVAAVAAVVDSSSFEHDVNTTATLQIKTKKLIIFFIITSFHYCKMQDCSYIYVPGLVLSNPGITPSSHITKQLKKAPGSIRGEYIPVKSRMQHFFYTNCLFRFASVKSALTTNSAI